MGSRPPAHPCWTDRSAAGMELAGRLESSLGPPEASILVALPRGGVAVAAEIARQLDLPLTTWAVRKLALPASPEFAIGAIAPGEVVLWDPSSARGLSHYPDLRQMILEREGRELRRRQQLFGDAAADQLRNRQLIVVDDGIATGLTVRAALLSLRQLQPQRLTLAVPVVASRVLRELRELVDEAVVLAAIDDLIAVGCHYDHFEQLSDHDVLALLAGCRRRVVAIPCGQARLAAVLTVPEQPRGLVLFAHGSGSSHRSLRNRLVSSVLVDAGFATLLFDLVTPAEALEQGVLGPAEVDTAMLGQRVMAAIDWAASQDGISALPLALVGSSTGAAAALQAAAARPEQVRAVVSRGGRPDLASDVLGLVRCPTLLIVGGHDMDVLELNQRAAAHLQAPHRLAVIPGASHLFKEAGTLQEAADLTAQWLRQHLEPPAPGD